MAGHDRCYRRDQPRLLMEQRIAVFDVDGTLLRGDCLSMAARRSLGPLGQLLAALACLPWLIGWQLRLVSAGRFKQQMIAAFGICEAVNQAQLQERADWLLPELRAALQPEALQRLRWHQHRGDRVLLCSASPRLLLQPLADWLGVELLCTELEQKAGQWQPKLASLNCKGPEKVRRLVEHLGALEGLMLEAYGDSKGDQEMLNTATIPHYRSFSLQPNPYPVFALGPLLSVFAFALLGYGFFGIWSQGDQLLPMLHHLWKQIALGMMIVILSYGIRYLRWRLLLQALNLYPSLRADARIWMGSYAFTATPGKSGEAVRSFLLRRECGVPLAPTLMALVVERLTDGTAVLLLLLLNLPLMLRWQIPLTIPIFVGLLIMLLTFVLYRSTKVRTQFKFAFRQLLPSKFASSGNDGLRAIRSLLQPMLLLQATFIGALAWSLEGVSLWLLLRGMGITSVDIGGATFAHAISCLFGVLTLLPGGLGSTEAATVGLLGLQGVVLSSATLVTLLLRLMTLWFVTALGVVCLLLPSSE